MLVQKGALGARQVRWKSVKPWFMLTMDNCFCALQCGCSTTMLLQWAVLFVFLKHKKTRNRTLCHDFVVAKPNELARTMCRDLGTVVVDGVLTDALGALFLSMIMYIRGKTQVTNQQTRNKKAKQQFGCVCFCCYAQLQQNLTAQSVTIKLQVLLLLCKESKVQ